MAVAFNPDGTISVRDTKAGETGPVLVFTQHEWECALDGVKKGEFDLPEN